MRTAAPVLTTGPPPSPATAPGGHPPAASCLGLAACPWGDHPVEVIVLDQPVDLPGIGSRGSEPATVSIHSTDRVLTCERPHAARPRSRLLPRPLLPRLGGLPRLHPPPEPRQLSKGALQGARLLDPVHLWARSRAPVDLCQSPCGSRSVDVPDPASDRGCRWGTGGDPLADAPL